MSGTGNTEQITDQGEVRTSVRTFRDLGSWALQSLTVPLQIIFTGGAIALVVLFAKWALGIDLTQIRTMLSGSPGGTDRGAPPEVIVVVGALVFAVGLGLLIFLWWLAARFFRMAMSGKLSGDGAAILKDLPFALPEGTIRAVLALIVAIVGLPLLLFSKVLQLDNAIAGYLNGIITGVFAYYFGSRAAAGTVPPAAARSIVNAENRANQAAGEAVQAKADAAASRDEAAKANRAVGFDSTLDQVQRHVKMANALVKVIGPMLPPGVLPDGLLGRLATTAATAQQVLDTVKGLDRSEITDDQMGRLTNVAGDLIGSLSGNTSPLGALLSKAAPMLGGLAIPGIGPAAGLISLLSIGARLGADEFKRWRARVLAAPIASGLIEYGTVTPQDAEAALRNSPLLRERLAPIQDRDGFYADLAAVILNDDALDRMWRMWGAESPTDRTLFQDRKDLEDCITEYHQALVALRAAHDIPDGLVKDVADTLSTATGSPTSLLSGGVLALDADKANQLVAAASDASIKAARGATTTPDAQAAFDALVMLTGIAKREGVDIARTLREVS